MAILKKEEFEREIREAIMDATGLWCDVEAVQQRVDPRNPTEVEFKVLVLINGIVEDLPE